MNDPTQFDAGRVRLALDHGEVVELDGGTLVLDGEESPSVVLRLTPWRARALSWVLEEWSAVSRVFNRPPRLNPDELDLSRVLELASSVAGDDSDEPGPPQVRFLPPGRSVPNRARLAAVAVLAERESRLTTIQRLALVDAASWWLSEQQGGQQLAHALLEAACTDDLAAEHAYLALITPPADPPVGPAGGDAV